MERRTRRYSQVISGILYPFIPTSIVHGMMVYVEINQEMGKTLKTGLFFPFTFLKNLLWLQSKLETHELLRPAIPVTDFPSLTMKPSNCYKRVLFFNKPPKIWHTDCLRCIFLKTAGQLLSTHCWNKRNARNRIKGLDGLLFGCTFMCIYEHVNLAKICFSIDLQCLDLIFI